MKIKLFIIFILFINLNINAQSQFKYFIDSIANEYLRNNNNLALIIGVVDNGEEKIYAYGQTEKGNKTIPVANDIFEIGQITQVFTSVLFADMTLKGEINSDDILQKYLPVDVPPLVYEKIICEPVQKEIPVQRGTEDYSRNVHTYYSCKPDSGSVPQPVLLCYLSTHTSGLPDLPFNLKSKKSNPFSNYKERDLYDFLRAYKLTKPVGIDYLHSNLGIALLGHVLEIRTKIDYEKMVNDRICSKLGMSQTRIKYLGDNNFILKGHSKKGGIAEYWTFDVMAPCGALHSNMEDMLKFLQANIAGKNSPLKDVLDYTHNPRIEFHDKKYGNSSVALGWKVNSLGTDNTNYVWQSGLTGGFASFIGFVETTKTGVVILSNIAAPVEELGKNILLKMN